VKNIKSGLFERKMLNYRQCMRIWQKKNHENSKQLTEVKKMPLQGMKFETMICVQIPVIYQLLDLGRI
jgi:hypothetical protein